MLLAPGSNSIDLLLRPLLTASSSRSFFRILIYSRFYLDIYVIVIV